MPNTISGARGGFTYTCNSNLTVDQCPVCGVTYAVPERLLQQAQERGRGELQWYCPHGHKLGFHGRSEADKLRERLDETRRRVTAERDLREHTERRLAAQKGATTKAKRRHAAGVCPCCSRTFKQLQRHMENKHADYLAEHGLPTNQEGRNDG